MVKMNLPEGDEATGAEVDARTHELMIQFESHFQEVVALHPDVADRRDHVFQAWAMQKIAGLQLAVEQIAMKFNTHVEDDLPF